MTKMTATEFLQKMIERRPDGTHRPQQERMVQVIEDAINNEENAIVQAGTGTGKSLGELIPAVLSGKRIAISTATKQLSEQITNIDLPLLDEASQELIDKKLSYRLLKGRDNYFCKRKEHEINQLVDLEEEKEPEPQAIGLFEVPESAQKRKEEQRANELMNLLEWGEKTRTGDRTEAPASSDEMWKQVSSTSAECPGKNTCPFGEECFAEYARDRARAADVVVINHAIAGMDLLSEGNMLGDRDVFIFDEVHELDEYLSSAWGQELTPKNIKDVNKSLKLTYPSSHKSVEKHSDALIILADELETILNTMETTVLDDEDFPADIKKLAEDLNEHLSSIATVAAVEGESEASPERKSELVSLAGTAGDLADTCNKIIIPDPDYVKWVQSSDKYSSLKTAPLRVGPTLQSYLLERNATMVATSATIAVGDNFNIPAHNLGMDEEIAPDYTAVDVGTPFNYRQQAMIYIPNPSDFPAPIGKDRFEHKDAVREHALELIEAAGGRALFLSSTASEARKAGEYFRNNLPTGSVKVLIQGEAPNSQLTDEFVDDETSVLCATMGMWHGLNAPGKTCQLVIIDKIPFTPVGDPLTTARQDYASKMGRNGFMEVYVAKAATKLAQGAGRLIRTEQDRGVIAIFDTRLLTKGYGRQMLKGLPKSGIYSDLEKVKKSLSNISKA